MKFVITINYSIEWVGSWTEYVPVEYESIEALYIDLNTSIVAAKRLQNQYWLEDWSTRGKAPPDTITFAGKKFDLDWFEWDDPEPIREYEINTLDHWFDNTYLG